MDALLHKLAGSPRCPPFKHRLSWIGILPVASEGALRGPWASGSPPGVPWEAGLRGPPPPPGQEGPCGLHGALSPVLGEMSHLRQMRVRTR